MTVLDIDSMLQVYLEPLEGSLDLHVCQPCTEQINPKSKPRSVNAHCLDGLVL